MNRIEWKYPWSVIKSPRPDLVTELRSELNQKHPLFGCRLVPIAIDLHHDDTLYKIENSEMLALVHLTWSGKAEPDGYPFTVLYNNWDDFQKNQQLLECSE